MRLQLSSWTVITNTTELRPPPFFQVPMFSLREGVNTVKLTYVYFFRLALPSSPPSFPLPLLPPSLNGTHINTNAYKNRRRREGNHFTSLCRLSTSRDSKGTSTSFVLLSLTLSGLVFVFVLFLFVSSGTRETKTDLEQVR